MRPVLRRRAGKSSHRPPRPPRRNQPGPLSGRSGMTRAEPPACPDTVIQVSQCPPGPVTARPPPVSSPQDQEITKVSRTAAAKPLPGQAAFEQLRRFRSEVIAGRSRRLVQRLELREQWPHVLTQLYLSEEDADRAVRVDEEISTLSAGPANAAAVGSFGLHGHAET